MTGVLTSRRKTDAPTASTRRSKGHFPRQVLFVGTDKLVSWCDLGATGKAVGVLMIAANDTCEFLANGSAFDRRPSNREFKVGRTVLNRTELEVRFQFR